MNSRDDFEENYRVVATKQAKAAGRKLFSDDKHRLWLIRELRELRFWPQNKDQFEAEKVFGAIKLDFNKIEQKWVRVFVYPDEERKVMWVIGVFAKKTNSLTVANQISVETAVSRVEQDIKQHKKLQISLERRSQLRVVKGGRR